MTTRKEFIAYSCTHAIIALGPNAHPGDFRETVKRCIRVADELENLGESPWEPAPRPVMQLPQAALVAMGQAQPPIAGSAAEENTRKLLANLPPGTPLAPVQAQGNPQAAPGSVGNPVTSGAVIASMGEVQGVQETQASVVVNPPNIIPAFPNAG